MAEAFGIAFITLFSHFDFSHNFHAFGCFGGWWWWSEPLFLPIRHWYSGSLSASGFSSFWNILELPLDASPRPMLSISEHLATPRQFRLLFIHLTPKNINGPHRFRKALSLLPLMIGFSAGLLMSPSPDGLLRNGLLSRFHSRQSRLHFALRLSYSWEWSWSMPQ